MNHLGRYSSFSSSLNFTSVCMSRVYSIELHRRDLYRRNNKRWKRKMPELLMYGKLLQSLQIRWCCWNTLQCSWGEGVGNDDLFGVKNVWRVKIHDVGGIARISLGWLANALMRRPLRPAPQPLSMIASILNWIEIHLFYHENMYRGPKKVPSNNKRLNNMEGSGHKYKREENGK